MRIRAAALAFLLLTAAAGIAACAGGGSQPGAPLLPNATRDAIGQTAKIQHVVILIQENRSFDNLFATFPGADGATTGKAAAMSGSLAQYCQGNGMPVVTQPTSVPLQETDLFGSGFGKNGNFAKDTDLPHIHTQFELERDKDKMDGFDLIGSSANGSGTPLCTYAYQYVDPADIAPYWDLAKQYVLADHTFQTQGSSSFTAHQ